MGEFAQGNWAYLWLVLAGFCATQPWRYLGVILSLNLQTDSEILVWVRLVSTALVAGLVARMLLLPAGALASVPLGIRLGAFLFGCCIFYLARKSLAAGVFSGGAVLVLAQYFLVP
jgi:hypothetical protein